MRSMTKQMTAVVALEATSRDLDRGRMITMDTDIVGEMEFFKNKIGLLEREVQSLLMEKEQLLIGKTELILKNERLSQHLMKNRGGNGGVHQSDGQDAQSLLHDVDALYRENRLALRKHWDHVYSLQCLPFDRFLKDNIQAEHDERRLLLEQVSSYKDLLESKLLKDPSNFPSSRTSGTIQLADGSQIQMADIEQMIRTERIRGMEVNQANQLYLWNMMVALFQSKFACARRFPFWKSFCRTKFVFLLIQTNKGQFPNILRNFP